MTDQSTAQRVQVFFDGACYLCSYEISFYQKRDKQQAIEFVDISKADFDAKANGLDPKEVNRLFHVKNSKGQVITGVDAFVVIWKSIKSLNFLSRIAQVRFFKFLMEMGYIFFVKIRPYLPRRKCETDACNL